MSFTKWTLMGFGLAQEFSELTQEVRIAIKQSKDITLNGEHIILVPQSEVDAKIADLQVKLAKRDEEINCLRSSICGAEGWHEDAKRSEQLRCEREKEND